MASVDTNVLVRWLTQDDPQQCAQVRRMFDFALHNQQPLFVPITVTLELEWVLRSRYRLPRSEILRTFNHLLETEELQFQAEESLEQALHDFRETTADFADCLHAGQASALGHAPLMSFDQAAARITHVQLIAGSLVQ